MVYLSRCENIIFNAFCAWNKKMTNQLQNSKLNYFGIYWQPKIVKILPLIIHYKSNLI